MQLFPNKQIIVLLAFGFFILVIVYGMCIEPYRVEIKNLQINDSGLSKVLQGKKAFHISDLHISKIGKRENKILNLIEQLQPDMIFLTGDYVTWDGNYASAITFLSKLKAKMGVWAVMGDYDYSSSRKSCLFCHEQGTGRPTTRHNVTFLRNDTEPIRLSNGDIWLVGIDPGSAHIDSAHTPTRLLNKNPAILLSHNPLIFNSIDNKQDVLILAGDTHGGQIPLPAWLWGILGYKKNAGYNQGLFQEGIKKMYVSRGIGTSHLPIRLLCPPELVVIHF